ncbi:MAG: BON domain-containing protein [Pseudomonadota bacterium]
MRQISDCRQIITSIKYVTFLFISVGLIIINTACTTVATTGAEMAYHRYDWQQSINNQKITFSIKQALHQSIFKNSHINVDDFNYRVLLTGTVPSEEISERAAQIAAYTKGVKHVYNFITISENKLGNYAYDSWLTTEVRTKIITQGKMPPESIKVVTDNATVYLMGLLTPKQAKIAVNTARYTNGVKRVVEIFQYIYYSDNPDMPNTLQDGNLST